METYTKELSLHKLWWRIQNIKIQTYLIKVYENRKSTKNRKWFKANKLSVNASKTNYMMLGTSHMTNKYIDVNKYCDANDTDNATNERSSKQKKSTLFWIVCL